ncbi:MAG: SMC-Scp complex subunit ScpB [bacterium]
MLTPPAAIEALLFASGEAMEKKEIGKLLKLSPEEVAMALEGLREQLAGRGVALIETAETAELRTSPEASEIVKALRAGELARDLGKAGLETLAIVLYKGGSTRSEIDWVRGVNSSATVRSLLLRGLIERVEDPEDKRRAKYRPTTEALAHLGLTSAGELPRYQELAALTEAASTPEAPAETA